MDEELARRLEAIERRLAALESSPAAAPPQVPPTSAVPPPIPSRTTLRDATVVAPPPTLVTPLPKPARRADKEALVFEQLSVTHTDPAPPPVDFEHVIGLKWAGWVGGVVLVIGAALGIKFAYDSGWLGGVSDMTRCGLIAAGGGLLLALGEAIYRRVNKYAAVGFYGAGVALLYLAVFAGEAWYGLFGTVTAVTLLTGVAAVGMAVAARADLVAVACTAVVGAVLCPAFTGVLDHRPPGFRVYLLAVESMAIGLCAWRARPKWFVLRGVALAAAAFDLFVGTPGETVNGFVLSGVVFGLVAAVVFQGELIFTTWRRPRGLPSEPVPGVIFSLLVTGVLVAILLDRMQLASDSARGAILAWLALATTTTGLFVAKRSVGLTLLGRGFFVQAMLLLAIAVPVTLHGPARLFGWMALSVGLAALARLTFDRAAAVCAAGVWVLAAVATGDFCFNDPAALHVWFTLPGEPVTAAAVLGLTLAISGHVAAWSVRRLFGPASDANAFFSPGLQLDLLAAAAFAVAVVAFQSHEFATRAALSYSMTAWAASLARPLAHLRPVALLVLTAAALKWAVADVLLPRTTPHWRPTGRPFFNPQAATGVAFAAAFAVTGFVDRRRVKPEAGSGDTTWTAAVTAALAAVGFGLWSQVDLVFAADRVAGRTGVWPAWTAEAMWITLIAATCVVGWAVVLRQSLVRPENRDNVWRAARVAAVLLAVKFAVVDVVAPALADAAPSPPAVLNLQVAVGMALIAVVAGLARPTADTRGDPLAGLFVLGLLLLTGSAEIDRYALRQTDAPAWIVRQVGWSIYWGVLAVATLLTGFATGGKRLRVAALVLLAVTLLKVILLDMAGVGTGWRIVSFLGLGGLLLLTSVLYGRLGGGEPVRPAQA